MADTNEALKEAGLEVKAEQEVLHMVEALIEEFSYDALGKPVTKPFWKA